MQHFQAESGSLSARSQAINIPYASCWKLMDSRMKFIINFVSFFRFAAAGCYLILSQKDNDDALLEMKQKGGINCLMRLVSPESGV
jgi:hypothetical protein